MKKLVSLLLVLMMVLGTTVAFAEAKTDRNIGVLVWKFDDTYGSPVRAAMVVLLANTAPVAFGAVGTPIITAGGLTGLEGAVGAGEAGNLINQLDVIALGLIVGNSLHGARPAVNEDLNAEVLAAGHAGDLVAAGLHQHLQKHHL